MLNNKLSSVLWLPFWTSFLDTDSRSLNIGWWWLSADRLEQRQFSLQFCKICLFPIGWNTTCGHINVSIRCVMYLQFQLCNIQGYWFIQGYCMTSIYAIHIPRLPAFHWSQYTQVSADGDFSLCLLLSVMHLLHSLFLYPLHSGIFSTHTHT